MSSGEGRELSSARGRAGTLTLKATGHVQLLTGIGVNKAERIVREELDRLGWPEEGLRQQSKGHRAKVQVARRLRQETTMSLKWIAQRLQMGSWTYVSNLLNEHPVPVPDQQALALFQ